MKSLLWFTQNIWSHSQLRSFWSPGWNRVMKENSKLSLRILNIREFWIFFKLSKYEMKAKTYQTHSKKMCCLKWHSMRRNANLVAAYLKYKILTWWKISGVNKWEKVGLDQCFQHFKILIFTIRSFQTNFISSIYKIIKLKIEKKIFFINF